MNIMLLNFLTPLPVILPLISAGLTLLFGRKTKIQIIISITALILVMLSAIALIYETYLHGAYSFSIGEWGILDNNNGPHGITMVADQLSTILILISSTILLCVMLFSIGQGINFGNQDTPVSIFIPTYLILTAGICNVFLTGDLFNLYVSFEVLLSASFVLLTIGVSEDRVRTGVSYVIVSIVSSLIFLAGVGFAYTATGTLNLALMAQTIDQLPNGTKNALFATLLVAFSIKAAIFPLSSWLPDSYPAAPAPVTAVFAGLLTKVGVYAIIRTNTLLFKGENFNNILMIAGLFTMILGIIGAISQTEIKKLLSYTLVSHIGYMIFGISVTNTIGLSGAIYYVVHHILVQTTLFLIIGLIEQVTGTSSLDKLRGLAKSYPLLAGMFFISAINLAGIPPFPGFIGKLSLLQAGIENKSVLALILVAGTIITSFLTLFVVIRIWSRAFWQPSTNTTESNNTNLVDENILLPKSMLLPTLALIIISINLSLFAGPLTKLTQNAAQELSTRTQYINSVLNYEDKNE